MTLVEVIISQDKQVKIAFDAKNETKKYLVTEKFHEQKCFSLLQLRT